MNKKILIIEDAKVIRENISTLLSEEGYKVFTANNGKDGLQKARENMPDLLLCDIKMPGMDGYEILEALSENDSTKSIPFIFLTAKVEKENISKGLSLGAVDYIFKPFDSDVLAEMYCR